MNSRKLYSEIYAIKDAVKILRELKRIDLAKKLNVISKGLLKDLNKMNLERG
jgi:hypothetical protein